MWKKYSPIPFFHRLANETGNASHYSIDLVLECMRGLASLWVFLFHISDLVLKSCPSLYPLAIEGHRGVPVFFVISGYCIISAAQKNAVGRRDSLSFIKRRFLRIFPPFWISVLLIILLPYLMEAISTIKTGVYLAPSPRWLAYNAMDWLAIATLTKDLVDNLNADSAGYTLINSVYWTLAIEFQFYFVVYCALTMKNNWIIFLTIISAISVISFFSKPLALPGMFLPFWPAFACGALLKLAHSRKFTPFSLFGKNELQSSLIALAAGFTAILVLVNFSSVTSLSFTTSALIASLVFWCMGGVEHATRKRPKSQNAAWKIGTIILIPFSWLGQCSYSLYLLHGKLYQLPEMFVRQFVGEHHTLFLTITLLSTLILCYIFYYLIERPFQNLLASPTPHLYLRKTCTTT